MGVEKKYRIKKEGERGVCVWSAIRSKVFVDLGHGWKRKIERAWSFCG